MFQKWDKGFCKLFVIVASYCHLLQEDDEGG